MSFIVLMRSTLVIKQQTGLYKQNEIVNNLTPRCSSSRCCVWACPVVLPPDSCHQASKYTFLKLHFNHKHLDFKSTLCLFPTIK